ncbi:AI-2E family transporter [Candidatus Shapirobacteria bacterium]|nr:AI-2E family transporter [Candidatus Shapirobacteria bacterium]
MKPQKIEITYKTIIFTITFVLGLWLIWYIRDILTLVFLSLMFMEVLNPSVTAIEKYRVPRFVSILLIYSVVLTFIGFTLAWIIPILVTETSGLLRALPSILDNIQLMGFSAVDLSSQFTFLESVPTNVARTIIAFFSNLVNGLLVIVMTFYLLLERPHLDNHVARIFGAKAQKLINEIFIQLERRLASWVNGELILMTSIGILSYLGYLSLGLNYALPLALIAGLLEVVPTAGPILATVLAALVGLTSAPITAIFATIWGIVVQQLENNFIVPKIMSAAVGIHPIVTILTIATGAKIGGVGGALLAVPVYLTIETIVNVLLNQEKKTSK